MWTQKAFFLKQKPYAMCQKKGKKELAACLAADVTKKLN